jgi:hypothetical protein
MSRSTGHCARTLAAVVVAFGAFLGAARAEGDAVASSKARLRRPDDRAFVSLALRGAARRLGDARCQELLGELRDRSQRPLRQALDAEGVSAPEFVDRLYFYDGSERGCGARRLAYTVVGSRVVFVCGDRFRAVYQLNTTIAEVAIIHEALHCLGLGENPPTWQEINAWVQAACRR